MKTSRLSELGKFVAYTSIGAALALGGTIGASYYSNSNTKAYYKDINNDEKQDIIIKSPFSSQIYLQSFDGSYEKLENVRNEEKSNTIEKIENKYDNLEDKVKDLN